MILFFDTETTGFPHKHKPVDHPDQPHVVQLAAALTEDDGRVVSSFNFIIDPGVERGVRIPSAAAAIHGIDEEKCWRLGQDPFHVACQMERLWLAADLIVGHNVDFDLDIIGTFFARHFNIEVPKLKSFCTMKASTDICRLPSPKGGYKWPKLGECIRHFFNEDLIGAHDAMVDVTACKRVYFHLMTLQAAA